MKNPVISSIIYIILTALLSAGAVMFPAISWLMLAACGVLLAIRAYKDKPWSAAILVAVSLITFAGLNCRSGVNADTVCAAVSGFLLSAACGYVIGSLAGAKKNYRTVISGGTLTCLAAFVTEFAKIRFCYKQDLVDVLIIKPMDEAFTLYTDILSSTGAEGAAEITKFLSESKWYIQQAMVTVIPSILILICAFIAFVIFTVARIFIERRGIAVMEGYPHFRELRMPRSGAFLLVVLYIATMFMDASPLTGAITNIVIILSAFYCVCGLAVVDFYLAKMRIPRILRLIIYAIGFTVFAVIGAILPFVNVFSLLLFLGMFDGVFDFRRLNKI